MSVNDDLAVWRARIDAVNSLPDHEDDDGSDMDEAGILKEEIVKEAILAKRLDVLAYMLKQDPGGDLINTIFTSSLLLKSPECAYMVHKSVDLSRMKDVFQRARSFASLDGSEVENDPVSWQLWETYLSSKSLQEN